MGGDGGGVFQFWFRIVPWPAGVRRRNVQVTESNREEKSHNGTARGGWGGFRRSFLVGSVREVKVGVQQQREGEPANKDHVTAAGPPRRPVAEQARKSGPRSLLERFVRWSPCLRKIAPRLVSGFVDAREAQGGTAHLVCAVPFSLPGGLMKPRT